MGGIATVTVLIQADLLVYQAATATPVVSAAVDTTGTGGLLQSPVPSHGFVDWTTSTTMSTEPTSIDSAAFLLVASGIKILNYSDAVASWQITSRA